MRVITSLGEIVVDRFYTRVSRGFVGLSCIVIKPKEDGSFTVWEFEKPNEIYEYFQETRAEYHNDRIRRSWNSRINRWLSRATGSVYEIDVFSEKDMEIFNTLVELTS